MNEVNGAAMSDRVHLATGLIRMDSVVVNSNGRETLVDKIRKGSQVSLSSVSDYQSDDSEDSAIIMERKSSLQEIVKKAEDKRTLYRQRGRSMSDGEAKKLEKDDPNFEVLPTLPSPVLETLEHRGDEPQEHINEEELEEKFASLALAFPIDATTIKDRWKRQRRSRDQTETNLNMEIDRLREKLTLMQPLCNDYEKAEIFSAIITQMDIIMNAASLAAISAERFGSVQHEERLTESIGLMVKIVKMLKQQRDATRRQLQYTKEVLQNSADSPRGLNHSPTNNLQTLSPISPNVKVIRNRRASVGTLIQQVNDTNPNRSFMEIKKIIRRPSDLHLRTGPLNRRPTRLELGGDLVKIKEAFAELSNESEKTSDVESEETHLSSTPNVSSPEEEVVKEIDISKLPLREKVMYRFGAIKKSIEDTYNTWIVNEKLHEVYTFGALICFSLSLVLLINILTEYEYAKRGILSWTGDNGKEFSNAKN